MQHFSVTPFGSYLEAKDDNSTDLSGRRLIQSSLNIYAVQLVLSGDMDVEAERDFVAHFLRLKLLELGTVILPIFRVHVYIKQMPKKHSRYEPGHSGLTLCNEAMKAAGESTAHCLRVGHHNQSGKLYQYSSSCSHVYCVFRHGSTHVYHHKDEHYGNQHSCRHGMHFEARCGCECYDETAGDNYYMQVLSQEAQQSAYFRKMQVSHHQAFDGGG
jgi:hypothetical protein